MKRACLAAFGVALLSGCQTSGGLGPEAHVVQLVQVTQDQAAKIQQGVRAVLKDPESARFGPAVVGKRADGLLLVCGYVNAKNSFGGYTRDRPFAGLLVSTNGLTLPMNVVAMGGTDSESYAAHQVCATSGINF